MQCSIDLHQMDQGKAKRATEQLETMREWEQWPDKSATAPEYTKRKIQLAWLPPQEILWLYCLWPRTHPCSHRRERASESCNHTSHSCKIASTATQKDIYQAKNYTTANKRGTAHHKNSHPDGQNNLSPGSDEPVMTKIDNWWAIAAYTSAHLTCGARSLESGQDIYAATLAKIFM